LVVVHFPNIHAER